jgi:hypothetical protein
MNGTEFGDILARLFSSSASRAVPLVCAVAAALIYAYKGKPWVGGAFLGFFLGPLGVFIAVVSGGWTHCRRPAYAPRPMAMPRMTPYTPPTPPPPAPRIEYRFPGNCPHCNGPIHKRQNGAKSIACFYCGAQVEATPVTASPL